MDCRTQLAAMAVEEREENHDHKYAIKLLNTSIKIDPNNYDLYFERSICYHKLGDYQASLEDANTAIRLNASHYNVHYQKGLALCGLNKVAEALVSFKRAIELRARQEDSKLSDIWGLLVGSSHELKGAKQRACADENNGDNATNATAGSAAIATNTPSTQVAAKAEQGRPSPGTSCATDRVDSTTDRPLISAGNQVIMNNHARNNQSHPKAMGNSSSLVASNCNINNKSNTNISNIKNDTSGNIHDNNNVKQISSQHQPQHQQQIFNSSAMGTNRVTSSANHHLNLGVGGNSHLIKTTPSDLFNTNSELTPQQQEVQYEWNIRRSERIFLHSSDSPLPNQQFNILDGRGSVGAPRQKTGSNPSSVTSSRGVGVKRPHDGDLQQGCYQQQQSNKTVRSKETSNSHAESDVDVDDSYTNTTNIKHQFNSSDAATTSTDNHPSTTAQKRVVIVPSSSMPATSQPTPAGKDDSYSSKYKRLRRDRERARRGTSKLCTIKPSDLEDLQKPLPNSEKRSMRVIAPIDGWLYSGQLSIDNNRNSTGALQYVVKLDGDTTGSSYLFNQETVLNDVIKEVRVKSVSELRKGARICCYWSRQYKCLSTGVVTSRTFEATKSLVSVKYDNGDLSALPLEDLRLLPPDYPKYMSNCDPLLLAGNGDGAHTTVIMTNPQPTTQQQNQKIHITPELAPPQPNLNHSNGILKHSGLPVAIQTPGETKQSSSMDDNIEVASVSKPKDLIVGPPRCEFLAEEDDDDDLDSEPGRLEIAEITTIPQTEEIIDFIANEDEANQSKHQMKVEDRITITRDLMSEEASVNVNRVNSAEENNYSIEYRPWVFDGPPKRSKRHGRMYRDNYSIIRRGNEVIRIGDSAELMPRDESILPFIAKIDGFWATGRGEMRVRVRWYYRLIETEGEPYELADGENALFETDHFDENDVQSIYRSTKILSWDEYSREHLGHTNDTGITAAPKIFYLAGKYDPVRGVKHLRSDVKESLQVQD